MAIIYPSAPNTFYDDGLTNVVSQLTGGRVVLIEGPIVADQNACWAEVGAADDSVHTNPSSNMGTKVIGFADVIGTPAIAQGDAEGGTTEYGRKITFQAIPNVPIVDPGTPTGKTVIGMALIKSVATLAAGVDTDVVYILDTVDIVVDGNGSGSGGVVVNLPAFEIELSAAINK